MAYFLKKTINKKGTYLQIYSSFYDPARGHTAHKAYKDIYDAYHNRTFPHLLPGGIAHQIIAVQNIKEQILF